MLKRRMFRRGFEDARNGKPFSPPRLFASEYKAGWDWINVASPGGRAFYDRLTTMTDDEFEEFQRSRAAARDQLLQEWGKT